MRNAAVIVFWVAVNSTTVACGGASATTRPAPPSAIAATDTTSVGEAGESTAPVAIATDRPRPPGPLTRPEVEALVARGLGMLLARVDVSAMLDAGHHFVRFRLDRADDLADWNAAGADVHLGDVIVRVNGIHIEHPEQALWAFERLRIARSIDVDLVRNGTPVTIRSPIVDPGAPRPSSSARE